MKDFWEEPKEKKINKKKIIITIITLIIVAAIAGITITYINNKEARTWIDKNILQKRKNTKQPNKHRNRRRKQLKHIRLQQIHRNTKQKQL